MIRFVPVLHWVVPRAGLRETAFKARVLRHGVLQGGQHLPSLRRSQALGQVMDRDLGGTDDDTILTLQIIPT